MVRPQYHLRPSDNGLTAWNLDRLIELSRELTIERVLLSDIEEVGENYWYAFDSQVPTCRSILGHIKLIEQADLAFPIILDADGRVMDGMHRVCKAILKGETHIQAVRFPETPDPDFDAARLQDLPNE